MEIHFTARHFRAHPTVKEHAIEAAQKLNRFYDGIRRCDIILSFDRPTNSVKKVEMNLHLNRTMLTALEGSEDFHKSIDLAVDKIERRLRAYKSKTRSKNRKKILRVKAKAV